MWGCVWGGGMNWKCHCKREGMPTKEDGVMLLFWSCYFVFTNGEFSLIHRNSHTDRLCNYSKHLSTRRKKLFFSDCITWTSAHALHPLPNKTSAWLPHAGLSASMLLLCTSELNAGLAITHITRVNVGARGPCLSSNWSCWAAAAFSWEMSLPFSSSSKCWGSVGRTGDLRQPAPAQSPAIVQQIHRCWWWLCSL